MKIRKIIYEILAQNINLIPIFIHQKDVRIGRLFDGARKRTRTSKPLLAPAPQAGVSTNFTIRANMVRFHLAHFRLRPAEISSSYHEVRLRKFLWSSSKLVSNVNVPTNEPYYIGHVEKIQAFPYSASRSEYSFWMLSSAG